MRALMLYLLQSCLGTRVADILDHIPCHDIELQLFRLTSRPTDSQGELGPARLDTIVVGDVANPCVADRPCATLTAPVSFKPNSGPILAPVTLLRTEVARIANQLSGRLIRSGLGRSLQSCFLSDFEVSTAIVNVAVAVMAARHFQHNFLRRVKDFIRNLATAQIIKRTSVQNIVFVGIYGAASNLREGECASAMRLCNIKQRTHMRFLPV
jgi:hypothetical protein